MPTPILPFTAVIGLERLKLALVLNAIDPGIGGVLVTGPRGTGKSTLARALAQLLGDAPFVNVPLGVSEEKLTGTLNLEEVLKNQQTRFEPGLLARAHNGVLYVDEVNLLPDHIVDQLLDVAASGVNHVERDAISHEHAARFSLIGTMNPEEGELRPQLLDRFGLCAALNNPPSSAARLAMAQQNRRFDHDAQALIDEHQGEVRQLAQRITEARARLTTIRIDNINEQDIAARCQQAQVDGIRADLIMGRAAMAYAALTGADSVDSTAIDSVAPLVLLHRAKTPQNDEAPSKGKESQAGDNDVPQQNGAQSHAEGHKGGLADELVTILTGATARMEDVAAKKP